MQRTGSDENQHGVRTEVRGHVGVVTLCRPPVNALGLQTLERLAAVLSDPTNALPDARAIALIADGPHFSAGHDREEQRRITEPGYLEKAASHLRVVLECPLPLVAGVDGAAIGTGFILAACADVLVVAPDAQVQLPEVTLGMLGGAGHALRWLPPAVVRHLVLLGGVLPGTALHSVGVLSSAPGAARDRALEVAEELAGRDAQAVAAARGLLDSLIPDAADVHVREMRISADFARSPFAGGTGPRPT